VTCNRILKYIIPLNNLKHKSIVNDLTATGLKKPGKKLNSDIHNLSSLSGVRKNYKSNGRYP
jgi:hypothetical protein